MKHIDHTLIVVTQHSPPPAPPEASVGAGQRPAVGLQRLLRACRGGGGQPESQEAV